MVSSWRRQAPDTLPAMAKASANYMNSQLIKMEALVNGYAEGLPWTPPASSAKGAARTSSWPRRESVHTASDRIDPSGHHAPIGPPARAGPQDHGDRAQHSAGGALHRDEVFFVGTAAEVTPIRTIDRATIGRGRKGEITARIQADFKSITSGQIEDRYHWLTPLR